MVTEPRPQPPLPYYRSQRNLHFLERKKLIFHLSCFYSIPTSPKYSVSLPLSQYSSQQSETHSSSESLRSLRKYISSIQDDAIRPLHILAGFYSHPLTSFNPTTEATTLLLQLVVLVVGSWLSDSNEHFGSH